MAKLQFLLFTHAIALCILALEPQGATITSDSWRISSDSHADNSMTGRTLKAEDSNLTEITTGYDIFQQGSGRASFAILGSFPERQSAALSLVLSLTPMVVSSACITLCIFIISLCFGKPAAWCVQVMLSEVFGMLLRYTKTFTNPWAQYHPAVPSKRCLKDRKKRRWLSWALTLTLLVGSVGWVTNAGMSELIKKRAVAVKGKSVTSFRVFLSEGTTISDEPLPPACISSSIAVSGDQPHFRSSSRFELCYTMEQVQVPPAERNGTRLVQLNTIADTDPGMLLFSISQGQWRHQYEISAFVATQSGRFRMMWEQAGSLAESKSFEKAVTEADLLGCANIQHVGSTKLRTSWAARNCTVNAQESLKNLAKAVVSNVAIEKSDSPKYLGVSNMVMLNVGMWNGAVIGYAEKGRVQAWIPIFIAVFAWLVGLLLASRMHLAQASMSAARCMHATSHDGECLKELWELESIPQEKMYRSQSDPKKVVLGMFEPAGYEQVSYFDAGDIIDLVGDSGGMTAQVHYSSNQSSSGTDGRPTAVGAPSSAGQAPSYPPAAVASPKAGGTRGSNVPGPIPVQIPSKQSTIASASPTRTDEVAPVPVSIPLW